MTLINMRSIRRAARGAGLIAVLATFGCEDSSGPVRGSGSYEATSFVITPTGGSPSDQIAAGSTVDLVLHSNGTTSGHMHVAAFDGDPAFDFDLTGTWTINGSTVIVDTDDDTFFRDTELTLDDETLVGDETFASGRVQITLTRD